MPVAVELHNGAIALATESDMARGRFMLTMSYSHDNWARALDIDEDGPADKNSAFDFGAGPYIVQFDSGETLLSYNTADQFHLRLGDEYAKNLTSERDIVAFDGNPGYWGCLCLDAPHRVLAAMPKVWEDRTTRPWTSDNDMMLCRYYLNHTIYVDRFTGGNVFTDEAWSASDDALFLGSQTDAQVSFGFMYDEQSIYLRIDRLDRDLSRSDKERVYLCCGDDLISLERTSFCVCAVLNGIEIPLEYKCNLVSISECDNADEWGIVTVIKLPRPLSDKLSVYAELEKCEDNATVSYGFTDVNKDDPKTWVDLIIK